MRCPYDLCFWVPISSYFSAPACFFILPSSLLTRKGHRWRLSCCLRLNIHPRPQQVASLRREQRSNDNALQASVERLMFENRAMWRALAFGGGAGAGGLGAAVAAAATGGGGPFSGTVGTAGRGAAGGGAAVGGGVPVGAGLGRGGALAQFGGDQEARRAPHLLSLLPTFPPQDVPQQPTKPVLTSGAFNESTRFWRHSAWSRLRRWLL